MGEFTGGTARWRSFHASGKLMAEGPYAANQPHGSWQFFHASGRLAAEGGFQRGRPAGTWRFYHDTAKRTLLSVGRMGDGFDKLGWWRHYDEHEKLIATARHSTPAGWHWNAAQLLSITPGSDGVRHIVHQGNATGDYYRLDGLLGGKDKIYAWSSEASGVYDVHGRYLTRSAGGWRSVDCHFSAPMKQAAQAGDVPALHALLRERKEQLGDRPACEPTEQEKPVAADLSRRIDALLASVAAVRSPTPAFVRELVPPPDQEDERAQPPALFDQIAAPPTMTHDMAKLLAGTMRWYIEWPHVDRQFISVLRSVPGYRDQPLKPDEPPMVR